jgi:chaperone LolA
MIALYAMAPTAAQVVTNVQNHYARLAQLQMNFDQKVTDVTFGKTTTSHGTLALAKPNSFRMSYAKIVAKKPKQDKDFVSDGKTLWIVDYMNMTVTVAGISANTQIPAIGAFLTNANLANDYTIALHKNTLELTPKQPTAGVDKVAFVVDPTTWDVTESIVTAPGGNASDFTFTAVTSGLIAPGTFGDQVKAHPTFKGIMAPSAPGTPVKPPPTKPAPAKPPATQPTSTQPSMQPTVEPATRPMTPPPTQATTAPSTQPTVQPAQLPTSNTP